MIYKIIFVAIAFMALGLMVAKKSFRLFGWIVVCPYLAFMAWREKKTEVDYHEICRR